MQQFPAIPAFLSFLLFCTSPLIKTAKKKNKLKAHAKALATNEDDFNRNWLFVYEALPQSALKDEWQLMKNAGVSFIKIPASKDAT